MSHLSLNWFVVDGAYVLRFKTPALSLQSAVLLAIIRLSEITAIPQADLLLVQNALGVDLLGTFCGLM